MVGCHGSRPRRRRYHVRHTERHLRPPGHHARLLAEDLEHFRRIGRLVEFTDTPGEVETALALSGSAAQSKIQTYPGDCDYFERVNILAPSRRAGLPDPRAPDAREGAVDPPRADLPAHRGQVRLVSGRLGARRPAGVCRLADRLVAARDRATATWKPRCRWQPVRVALGGGVRRPGLVQAGLGGGRPGPRPAGQRQQHAGRHLGGARRDDHPAGRLSRPVLPGGLPGGGVRSRSSPSWPSTSRPTPWTNTSSSWSGKSTST